MLQWTVKWISLNTSSQPSGSNEFRKSAFPRIPRTAASFWAVVPGHLSPWFVMPYDVEYLFGHFVSAVLAVSSLSLLCPPSWLAAREVWEAEKSLSQHKHCLATVKTVCYQYYFHIKSKKHSTVLLATRKKLTLSHLKPGQQGKWGTAIVVPFGLVNKTATQ